MSVPINHKQRTDSEPFRGVVPALALLLLSMTVLTLMVVKVLWV